MRIHEQLYALGTVWDGRPPPSREELFWALGTVRSRSFSGPFAGGSAKTAAAQLGFAVLLALVYTLSGAGEASQAVNGVLAVAVSVVLTDLVFARGTQAKRYALHPYIFLLSASCVLLLLLAPCFLLPASCFLLPTFSFLLPTSCVLLPAFYFLLPNLVAGTCSARILT